MRVLPWFVGAVVVVAVAQLGDRVRDRHAHPVQARHLGQQLDNTRVEKNILHHSLQESDRRTES